MLTISVLDFYLKHATFEVVTAMLMEKKSPFGCYATPCRRQFPTFRRSVMPPLTGSSNPQRLRGLLGSEDGGSTLLQNVGEYLLVDT